VLLVRLFVCMCVCVGGGAGGRTAVLPASKSQNTVSSSIPLVAPSIPHIKLGLGDDNHHASLEARDWGGGPHAHNQI